MEDPETTEWLDINNSCGDEPYDKLNPHLKKDAGTPTKLKNLVIGIFL